MKLPIPDGFFLGGLWWTVEQESNMPAEYSHYAETIFRKEMIRLGMGYSEQRNEESFLHEVIHVISECSQAGLSEKQIGLLSYGLLSVFRQLKEEP